MTENKKINYNDLMDLKRKIENLFGLLKYSHQNLLNLIEDTECMDDEKFDQFHSYLKEYEAKIEIIRSDFSSLNSENKKLESCLSQTRLLKKKRMVKLESKIEIKKNNDDEDDFLDELDLPF